jgi:hypothetical protein
MHNITMPNWLEVCEKISVSEIPTRADKDEINERLSQSIDYTDDTERDSMLLVDGCMIIRISVRSNHVIITPLMIYCEYTNPQGFIKSADVLIIARVANRSSFLEINLHLDVFPCL